MRGLPSCGKTTTARRLVAEGGETFEFDEYFYTQVGTNPAQYDWSSSLLPAARAWNIERICAALDRGVDPVVLDDDNGLGRTTRASVAHAAQRGYTIQLCEPESPWWPEVRQLLNDYEANRSELHAWAAKLAVLSRGTHRVPVESFVRRMKRWRPHLTADEILAAALAGDTPHVRT